MYSAGQLVTGSNTRVKKSRLARKALLEFINKPRFSNDLNGASIVIEKITLRCLPFIYFSYVTLITVGYDDVIFLIDDIEHI